MARLAVTAFTPPGSYPAALPLVADAADFTFTGPGVAADGISFLNVGREILLARNIHATNAATVTISSVAYLGRTGDITAYSLAAGDFAAFGPFDPTGWNQSGGLVYAVGSATDIKFAVLKLDSNIFPRA